MQTNYHHLTDEELLREALHQLDPLTSTEVQEELTARFEKLLGQLDQFAGLQYAFEHKIGLDLDDDQDRMKVVELLEVLEAHHVDGPETAKHKLERADKFYDIAEEAGNAFAMLAELASATL